MNSVHFPSNHILDVKQKFTELLSKHYSLNEMEVIFRRLLEHMQLNPFDKNILFNQSELIVLSEYIHSLQQEKPIEYILAYSYFFNLKFFVNEHVLIPRPETEELVYHLKNILQKKYTTQSNFKILDIGTGSGGIAITLKKIFSDLRVDAIDISEQAIHIAQQNARFHQTEVNFYQLDILKNELNKKYNVIISNPPYIPKNDEESINHRVKKFEPSIALFSNTSTEFYKRIFELSAKYMETEGLVFLELNQFYSKEILELAQKYNHLKDIEIIKDWSGNDRFIKCIIR